MSHPPAPTTLLRREAGRRGWTLLPNEDAHGHLLQVQTRERTIVFRGYTASECAAQALESLAGDR